MVLRGFFEHSEESAHREMNVVCENVAQEKKREGKKTKNNESGTKRG